MPVDNDAPRTLAVEIRLATVGDLSAITAFASEVVHDTYDSQIGEESAERLLEWWGPTLSASIEDQYVRVAVDGDTIVGLVERGSVDGEPVVWKLYVRAPYRGAGIGQRLLSIATAEVAPDHDRLLLEHLATNGRAARFYEREGFEVIGREHSEQPENDLVWRAKRLTSRPSA